jgi:small subunit ribosomal protein S17
MEASTRNARRTLRGTVVSDKMEKTITVRVERRYKHPKYGKYIRAHEKYHAHDEKGEAHEGDFVEIVATRPISKSKRWRLGSVLEASRYADAPEATKLEGVTVAGAKGAPAKASDEDSQSAEGGDA